MAKASWQWLKTLNRFLDEKNLGSLSIGPDRKGYAIRLWFYPFKRDKTRSPKIESSLYLAQGSSSALQLIFGGSEGEDFRFHLGLHKLFSFWLGFSDFIPQKFKNYRGGNHVGVSFFEGILWFYVWEHDQRADREQVFVNILKDYGWQRWKQSRNKFGVYYLPITDVLLGKVEVTEKCLTEEFLSCPVNIDDKVTGTLVQIERLEKRKRWVGQTQIVWKFRFEPELIDTESRAQPPSSLDEIRFFWKNSKQDALIELFREINKHWQQGYRQAQSQQKEGK